MFKIDHSPLGKKLHNPDMSNDRLREIALELGRLIDAKNLALKRQARLGAMAGHELDTYLQRNSRISILCQELGEDWPDLRAGASRLVN